MQKNTFDWLGAPVKRVVSEDVPLFYSAPFMQVVLPNTEKVVRAAREALYLV